MILSNHLLKYKILLISFLLFAFTSVQANQLKSVRAWPSPDKTRVVFDFSSKPTYDVHYLTKPDRLVVDIKSTTSVANLKKLSHKGPLVKNIRESASGSKNTYRLVIDLKKSSKAHTFVLAPAKPYGHRLVIDLPNKVASKPVKDTPSQSNQVTQATGRDVIIAIDAGHGGEDPGAIGKFSQEKNITLQIAKRLKKRINNQNGMHAFLIRTGDYYVNLNRRSELAFKGKADFLVSIHADGYTSSKPSGASVWILSDRRANSEMGRRMERHEVHSELLGGKGENTDNADSVPFLNKVFFDMSKANSMQVGSDVGTLVVKELKNITKLHKKKPVGASLAVLKSPYIPSILVEAGFITNHREERILNQADHQNKIANAVFQGIYRHFKESPPHDSLFAQKKRVIKHTVRSGESLSILAERYSVSRQSLKSINKLKSDKLHIGQVLNIPSNYQLTIQNEPKTTRKLVSTAPTVHKVKSGESLSVIAHRYGKSADELKSYNKLRSTSLAIGQQIKIPGTGFYQEVQAQTAVHSVKPGESLSVIAQRYGKTTSELKSYNKLRSTSLAVGQKIKIPGGSAIQTTQVKQQVKTVKPSVHQVKSGESLSVIAKRYGKTTSELKSYNKLRSTSLAIGQKIKIPGGSATQTVQVKQQTKTVQASVHQVKSGESLSVIAQRYGKTTSELKSYNKLRSTSLAVGQKIKVPGGSAMQSTQVKQQAKTVKPSVHQVKSGESLSGIAQRYGKTTSELKNYNKLRSTSLAIGQKIKIPGGSATQTTQVKQQAKTVKPSVHQVKSGESLSVIAKRYGKTVSELKSYNRLSSTSLSIGQKIKIPGAGNIAKNTSSASNRASVHTVRKGESLSVIAKRYGTTSQALKNHNKLSSMSLAIGQKVKIPADASKVTIHKVRSGESLSVIAKRYGTTASQIKSINKLRSSSLAIGQLLTIPTT